MTDRSAILRRLRRATGAAVELPQPTGLAGAERADDDRVRRFVSALESVAGRCVVASRSRLAAVVEELSAQVEARSARCAIGGLVPAWPDGAGEPCTELADVDFLAVAGELAVAENGAVWITDAALADRAALFLAQHVAVVVPYDAVVETMHQAYQRVEVGTTAFGVFVSGPSKTADIEQCLVIGAHGPRSLTVVLVR